MTAGELLKQIRGQLRDSVDPKYREGLIGYFKESLSPYGVRGPKLKKIVSQAYRNWKDWPAGRQDRFCERLWKSGKLEEGSIAIYLYHRLAKRCTSREFRLFENWIDHYVNNWAHCDGVASWLIAASIANEPPLMDNLPAWTGSRNRWKRRAAAVSLLQEAKKGRNTDRIFQVAESLLEDADDMVQKGVGWLLKETYPKKPREVVAFLRPRKSRAPRLLLRYAAEKMTARDRIAVLE
jgi:3-methyladenine DNA glycosylase AlkD